MTLRKFLLIPLIVSLGLFIYFSGPVRESLVTLLEIVNVSTGFWLAIGISILLQLVGHIIRAYKAQMVFGVAKESSVRFQFRALSIGYLFNTLLPFRLGELVRARVISGAMSISFGYALVLVLFERLIDIVILGLIACVLIALGWFTTVQLPYVILLICLAIIGLLLYTLVIRQNKYLLSGLYNFTKIFNDRLKTTLRFKAWTIIYGLQQTFRHSLIVRYALLSASSWVLYGLSLFVIVSYVLTNLPASSHITAALAPYYGISVPAGPASLGVFSRVVNDFTATLHLSVNVALTYNLIAWAVLVIPITTIGLVLLYAKTREALWYDRPHNASADSLSNKLYRTEDISDEMEVFLENYFSGNTLSRIVHNLELREDFKLVKYFKGGSDAITILALQNGEKVVKKIIPIEFEDRLKAQYDWLVANQRKPGIVRPLAEYKEFNFYAIDLEYDAANEMFYEYIHRRSIAESKRAMDDVWVVLLKNVYGRLGKLTAHAKERDAYIEKHIWGCLEKAAVVDPDLIRATEPEKIIINGVTYDNLYQIMEKIKRHPQAWVDIATYRQSKAVHGDVIVDNLLISKKTEEILIIDPAPDGNIIEGPVFDFGKNLQSLHCGYETLLRDEDAVYLENGNTINYRDQRSAKYTQLTDYVKNELAARHLTESEQRAMLFHAAALYIRRLKHQVYYTPANVLKFYAVGVKTLNDFLAQYDERV